MSENQFFKFRRIDKRFIESLVKGTLYFAHPRDLNDPFDCKLDVRKAISNAVSKLEGESRDKLQELSQDPALLGELKRIEEVGICSFSLELKKTLLWSHYADDHKGVSVLYDFPTSFFEEKAAADEIIGVSKVTYKENYLTDWFVSIANDLPWESSKLVKKLAKKIWTAKSPAWDDEEEARIISLRAGSLKIPEASIKQICFGLRTPDEDIELVQQIVHAFDYEVGFCKVERTHSDFGIDVKEI